MNARTWPAGSSGRNPARPGQTVLLAQLVARFRALLRVVTLEGAFSLTSGKGGR